MRRAWDSPQVADVNIFEIRPRKSTGPAHCANLLAIHASDGGPCGLPRLYRHLDTTEKRVSSGITILRTSCLFLRQVHFSVHPMPTRRYAEDGGAKCR